MSDEERKHLEGLDEATERERWEDFHTDDLTDLLRLADPRDEPAIKKAWEQWSRTLPETFWDVAVWFGDEWRTGSLDVANRYEIFAHVTARLAERVKAAEAERDNPGSLMSTMSGMALERDSAVARADAAEAREQALRDELQAKSKELQYLEVGIAELATAMESEAIGEGYEESHWAEQARALLSPPTAHVYDGERCVECGVNCYDAMLYGPEYCLCPPTADTDPAGDNTTERT